MRWMHFYASTADLPLVQDTVAADADLALLASEKGNWWKATLDVTLAGDGRYALWHVPTGPLPLMPGDGGDATAMIDDPFGGWRQLRFSDLDGRPFFDSSPGVLWLDLHTKAKQPGCNLGMSSIDWIGNRFWALGRTAPEVTKKRWNKLRRDFSRLGPRVPRGGINEEGKPEVIALPGALEMLREGVKAATFPL